MVFVFWTTILTWKKGTVAGVDPRRISQKPHRRFARGKSQVGQGQLTGKRTNKALFWVKGNGNQGKPASAANSSSTALAPPKAFSTAQNKKDFKN